MTPPLTPETRAKKIATDLAAGPCELGGDNMLSCPTCLSAIAAAIREAEQAAWRRGVKWMRRRVHAYSGCRTTAIGDDHDALCVKIHAIEIPESEPCHEP